MLRRSKIVATLGPATEDYQALYRLIQAGVDVVRLNFSHGAPEDHIKRAEMVRSIARARGRAVGVLVDLQGPKIRIGRFADGRVTLARGDAFVLDAGRSAPGDQEGVGLDYKELPKYAPRGSVLLLDDGRIVMEVEKVDGPQVHCRVTVGGVLSNNKGINRMGGGLAAEALTDKDRQDIRTAAALAADYIAVSFPRDGDDMRLARRLVEEADCHARLVAKVERAEAIDNLEDIVDASDAIMVARGDLGVEVGDAAVPGLQKRIIREARVKNRLVITATQMMESMIQNPIPTRAEVSDVANAVIDGTDAVMLSGETAVGKYPVETVEAVHRVCLEAEKHFDPAFRDFRFSQQSTRIDEAIAMAVMFTQARLQVRAIVALTQTGSTALWLSRLRSDVPIYALTPETGARRRMTLYRGVYPINFRPTTLDSEQTLREAEDELRRRGAVRDGDLIIVTIGEPMGQSGGTNAMKIVQVGDDLPVAG